MSNTAHQQVLTCSKTNGVNLSIGKVVLLLAETIPASLYSELSGEDVILVPEWLTIEHPHAKIERIEPLEAELQRTLSDMIESALSQTDWRGAEGIVDAYANDLYAYLFRPLFTVVEALQFVIHGNIEKEVLVVHANRKSGSLPITGFTTLESPRGSKSLLGAFIAHQLRLISPLANRVRFIEVKGDIWCNERFRKLFLSFLDVALHLRLARELFLLRRFSGAIRDNKGKGGGALSFVVRALHQVRFSIGLASRIEGNINFIIIPQFTQGSALRVVSELGSLGKNQHIIAPTLFELIASWRSSKIDVGLLKDANGVILDLPWKIDEHMVSFSISGIATEIGTLRVLLTYRRMLGWLMRKASSYQMVNFELVGRMAGIDRLAADDANASLTTVQTALIADIKLPVFPFAHRFYVDGPMTMDTLRGVGSIGRGEVRYGGAVVKLHPMTPQKPDGILAYFTQPYEYADTMNILKDLISICYEQKRRLLIKLHPRDAPASYTWISKHASIVNIISRDIPADSVIKQADICLTRTSSVAKEALAFGRPVILCQWSDLDRSTVTDFNSKTSGRDHRVRNLHELRSVLSDPMGLERTAIELRKIIFGDRDIEQLALKLVCE